MTSNNQAGPSGGSVQTPEAQFVRQSMLFVFISVPSKFLLGSSRPSYFSMGFDGSVESG